MLCIVIVTPLPAPPQIVLTFPLIQIPAFSLISILRGTKKNNKIKLSKAKTNQKRAKEKAQET